MEEPKTPLTPRKDAAEQAGRVAGATVTALGRRLLRVGPLREALRRAKQEADPPAPPDDRPAPT